MTGSESAVKHSVQYSLYAAFSVGQAADLAVVGAYKRRARSRAIFAIF
jgi:hypothetical protein